MLLAPTLKNRFNTSIRERGYQYFSQQRVWIRYGSSSELGAQVRGSQPYRVMLQWTGSQLAVLCECPYFVDQAKPCKHLWAAVLAADEAKHLSDAASSTRLTLDMDTLLDQFAALDGAAVAAKPASLHRQSRPAFKPPLQPAAWKKQMSSIFQPPASP